MIYINTFTKHKFFECWGTQNVVTGVYYIYYSMSKRQIDDGTTRQNVRYYLIWLLKRCIVTIRRDRVILGVIDFLIDLKIIKHRSNENFNLVKIL